MPRRTTVNVSLTPELDAFLDSRVKSGRYQTTSEVVREALRLLERQEAQQEDTLRRLRAKLEHSASQAERGELLDGEEVFASLRRLIAPRPVRKKAQRAKTR
jgi:antitoxin ParD1/3/4